jgi:GTP-binding protein HflX
VQSATRVVEVWNKIDLLPAESRPPRMTPERASGEGHLPAIVAVSALTGEGLPELLALIEQRLSGGRRIYTVELAGAALASLHRLYEFGDVIERRDTDEGATVASVRVPVERDARFLRAFPDAKQAG